MAARISGSGGSYQSGAKNNSTDITTVQELLTAAAIKQKKSVFDPGGIDGKISRTAERSGTVKAITQFQRLQIGMVRPDQRIDVNGKTWKKLVQVAGSIPPTSTPGTS